MMDMGFREDFEQKKGGDNRPKIQREPRDPTVEVARKDTSGKECTGCGQQGHLVGDCRLKDHPQFNKTTTPWVESEVSAE